MDEFDCPNLWINDNPYLVGGTEGTTFILFLLIELFSEKKKR